MAAHEGVRRAAKFAGGGFGAINQQGVERGAGQIHGRQVLGERGAHRGEMLRLAARGAIVGYCPADMERVAAAGHGQLRLRAGRPHTVGEHCRRRSAQPHAGLAHGAAAHHGPARADAPRQRLVAGAGGEHVHAGAQVAVANLDPRGATRSQRHGVGVHWRGEQPMPHRFRQAAHERRHVDDEIGERKRRAPSEPRRFGAGAEQVHVFGPHRHAPQVHFAVAGEAGAPTRRHLRQRPRSRAWASQGVLDPTMDDALRGCGLLAPDRVSVAERYRQPAVGKQVGEPQPGDSRADDRGVHYQARPAGRVRVCSANSVPVGGIRRHGLTDVSSSH